MPLSDNKPPEEFSKSKRKNEMLALQEIGEALIALSETQLAKVPLPDNLLEAIQLAHTLKTHEAKRRHLQYIGKIMRNVDPEPIKLALAKIQSAYAQNIMEHHEIERWRDTLVDEGDIGLQKLMDIYPKTDRQYLRQLIRKAQQDKVRDTNSGAYTELFRYLRQLFRENLPE